MTQRCTSENIGAETRNTGLKGHGHPWVHCSVIYNRPDMEAARVPLTDEWTKQLWHI